MIVGVAKVRGNCTVSPVLNTCVCGAKSNLFGAA